MKRLLLFFMLVLLTATLALAQAPQYAVRGNVSLAPYTPRLTAVDPYANAVSSADGLKPARPFWYVVDEYGLTILRIDDNRVVYRVPWPQTIQVALPEGDDFMTINAPPGGWEPVAMTVSYPTEESLASTSETPATYVFVVMAHSGYEWASNPNPPDLRSSGLRDTLVPSTNPATESSMLVQVDVTDPSFSPDTSPTGPMIAGAILGHGAGQPTYEPGLGNVYIGNMPSRSLPTGPKDLTSFVSVITPIALAETAAAEPANGAPPDLPLVLCGPEHPDEGIVAGKPYVWPCVAEGAENQQIWEFRNLPPWLTPHHDKLTGELDGILYGTAPSLGTWIFEARVTDLGEDPANPEPLSSDWTPVTVSATTAAQYETGEGGFEAGVPGGMAVDGSGSCTLAPTSTSGSIVPRWIDVQTAELNGVVIGCYIMGTAPISGEYYEFAMPGFHFVPPFETIPVVFSGNVIGTYGFVPLPQGVSISGLAWHEIDKIHDPSTEADILNGEFIGVDPFTGQLYQILLPQGVLETGNEAAVPPETSPDIEKVNTIGEPLARFVAESRPDIANVLAANSNLMVRFGDLMVEADRNPSIYVTATQIVDATGSPLLPIGGSTIENGALLKVSALRGTVDSSVIAWPEVRVIDTPGVQAYYVALDSDLSPAIRGQERGQVDHGVLWVSGTSNSDVAVVDTAYGQTAQTFTVPNAAFVGGLTVDFATRSAYVANMSAQNVTVFGIGTPVASRAPTVWTAPTMTFNLGEYGEMPIVATGWPTPRLSYEGLLPPGLAFVDHGDGTATVSGTPAPGTGNDYALTITASNGVPPDGSFGVILTVMSSPTITSANTATFTVGVPGSFTVTTTGAPSMLYVSLSGEVPTWLTITQDEATGVTTLDGTPPPGSEGSYAFTITASTGIPPEATQPFILFVNSGQPTAPSITSANSTTFTAGTRGSFTATATGYPVSTLSIDGTLPAGVTFTDNHNGTATLTGTPAAGNEGTHRFNIVATNGVAPNATQAFAMVVNAAPPQIAPVVVTQPAPQNVLAGQTATFMATASGSPAPAIQWQMTPDYASAWTNIPGATGARYTTPVATPAINGYQFRAMFSNNAGTTTSDVSTLTVIPVPMAPTIISADANTFTVGSANAFTVKAVGWPTPSLTYTGTLPFGVSFKDNGYGTATLSGTPMAEGTYTFSITAANGMQPNATQNFTLTFMVGQIKRIRTVGKAPEAIAVDKQYELVYVGSEIDNPEMNVLYMVGMQGWLNTPTTSIVKGYTPTPGEGEYIGVNWSTHRLYHAQNALHQVTVIDPFKTLYKNDPTHSILGTIDFGAWEPEGVAIDVKRNIIYIGAKGPQLPTESTNCTPEPGDEEECRREGAIFVFDGRTTIPTYIMSIPAGDDPESVVFNAAADKVYAANEDDGTVTIANAVVRTSRAPFYSGGRVLNTVKVFSNSVCAGWDKAEEADKMAVDERNNFVYITDDKYRVAKISGKTNEVVGILPIGTRGKEFQCPVDLPLLPGSENGANSANNIAVSSDSWGNVRIYVTSEQDFITMIDPRTFNISGTLRIPKAVHLDGIAVIPDSNAVFVTDEGLPQMFEIRGQCAKGIASACTLVP